MWEYAIFLAQNIAMAASEMKDRPDPMTVGRLKAYNNAMTVYLDSLENKRDVPVSVAPVPRY